MRRVAPDSASSRYFTTAHLNHRNWLNFYNTEGMSCNCFYFVLLLCSIRSFLDQFSCSLFEPHRFLPINNDRFLKAPQGTLGFLRVNAVYHTDTKELWKILRSTKDLLEKFRVLSIPPRTTEDFQAPSRSSRTCEDHLGPSRTCKVVKRPRRPEDPWGPLRN